LLFSIHTRETALFVWYLTYTQFNTVLYFCVMSIKTGESSFICLLFPIHPVECSSICLLFSIHPG
jgi:hypothetical protein